MGTMPPASGFEIEEVVAIVTLTDPDSVPIASRDAIADPNHLHVRVALSAVLGDGTTIATEPHLAIGGPRRGIGAIWCRDHGPPLPKDEGEQIELLRDYRVGREDIEDAINEHLGHDSQLQNGPVSGWQNLVQALSDAGRRADQRTLVTVPLRVELTPEVVAALPTA
jgi:hypothetical protein